MEKKWCRAVWREAQQEEEGVIPSIWVVGQKVMWPTTKNVIRLMQEMKEPEEKWESFPLIKIKLKSDSKKECENYDDTTTAELSDDDDTQEITLVKRKSKKKVYNDFVIDDHSPEPKRSQSKQMRDLPPPPAPPRTNVTRDLEKEKKQPHHSSTSYNDKDSCCNRERSYSRDASQRRRSRTISPVNRSRSPPVQRPLSSSIRRSRSPVQRPSSSSIRRSRSPFVQRPSSSLVRTCGSRSRSPSKHRASSSSFQRSTSPLANRTSSVRAHRSRSPATSLSIRKSIYHSSPSMRRSRSRSPFIHGASSSSVQRSRSFIVHQSSSSLRSCGSRSVSPLENRSRSISPVAHGSSSSSMNRIYQSISSLRSCRSRSMSPLENRSRSISPVAHGSSSTMNRTYPSTSHSFRDRSPTRSDGSRRKETYPMPEERFQRRVLYLLSEIRDLLKHGNKVDIVEDEDDVMLKQTDKLDEFKSFDERLNDKKEYAVHRNLISRIGGTDFGDHLKKAMQRYMSNKVMSDMNLSGKKNKYSFGKSNLYKLIKEICLKYQNVTETMVAEKVAAYLKYAPERTGGGGRKQQRQ